MVSRERMATGEWKRETTLMRGRKRRGDVEIRRKGETLTRAPVGGHEGGARKGAVRWEKPRRRQPRSQPLHVSGCKAPHAFGFSERFAKSTTETLGEKAGGGIRNQRPRPGFQTLTLKT